MNENAQKIYDILMSADDNTTTVNGQPFYFDMGFWRHQSRNTSGYEKHPCGTVGCISGLVDMVTDRDLSVDKAGDWLGLISDSDLAHELFGPQEVALKDVTSKMAAKALKFAAEEAGDCQQLREYWETLKNEQPKSTT
jgi:hypothetical protein